jgi:tripartite ATP-independent transporter DctM subunit
MMAAEILAPLMFAGLVVFLLLGYPVAFSIGAVGIIFGIIGIEAGLFPARLLQAVPERIFGIMSNQLLLAIPFFTFMGILLEKSGLAEDLLDTMGQLFGPLRGGLGLSIIFVGALLAATTGVVAASVISMGLISLPIMLKYNYNKTYATGVILASATLAQIIPPSLVLIVMADQLGVSVGDMYRAALLPAGLTVALYLIYTVGLGIFRPQDVPALPLEARTLQGSALLRKVVLSMIPPLGLIFLVLGTTLIGLATPTEAGALGVVGAIVLSAINRRLNWQVLWGAMEATAKLTAFVLFILIGSTIFALAFRGVDGDLWVDGLLQALPGGEIGFLIFVMLLVFALGFFIDFFEIAFIVLPLLSITAKSLDINLIWFGLLVGVNLQTSFLTPPFGFALFYLRSVAPATVKTIDIYKGAVPFIILQLIVLILTFVFKDQIIAFVGG